MQSGIKIQIPIIYPIPSSLLHMAQRESQRTPDEERDVDFPHNYEEYCPIELVESGECTPAVAAANMIGGIEYARQVAAIESRIEASSLGEQGYSLDYNNLNQVCVIKKTEDEDLILDCQDLSRHPSLHIQVQNLPRKEELQEVLRFLTSINSLPDPLDDTIPVGMEVNVLPDERRKFIFNFSPGGSKRVIKRRRTAREPPFDGPVGQFSEVGEPRPRSLVPTITLREGESALDRLDLDYVEIYAPAYWQQYTEGTAAFDRAKKFHNLLMYDFNFHFDYETYTWKLSNRLNEAGKENLAEVLEEYDGMYSLLGSRKRRKAQPDERWKLIAEEHETMARQLEAIAIQEDLDLTCEIDVEAGLVTCENQDGEALPFVGTTLEEFEDWSKTSLIPFMKQKSRREILNDLQDDLNLTEEVCTFTEANQLFCQSTERLLAGEDPEDFWQWQIDLQRPLDSQILGLVKAAPGGFSQELYEMIDNPGKLPKQVPNRYYRKQDGGLGAKWRELFTVEDLQEMDLQVEEYRQQGIPLAEMEPFSVTTRNGVSYLVHPENIYEVGDPEEYIQSIDQLLPSEYESLFPYILQQRILTSVISRPRLGPDFSIEDRESSQERKAYRRLHKFVSDPELWSPASMKIDFQRDLLPRIDQVSADDLWLHEDLWRTSKASRAGAKKKPITPQWMRENREGVHLFEGKNLFVYPRPNRSAYLGQVLDNLHNENAVEVVTEDGKPGVYIPNVKQVDAAKLWDLAKNEHIHVSLNPHTNFKTGESLLEEGLDPAEPETEPASDSG